MGQHTELFGIEYVHAAELIAGHGEGFSPPVFEQKAASETRLGASSGVKAAQEATHNAVFRDHKGEIAVDDALQRQGSAAGKFLDLGEGQFGERVRLERPCPA
jgi:hypothetical protein